MNRQDSGRNSKERAKKRTKVTIYSDGAARGNPEGPGGYGTILQFTDSQGTLHEKELSEGFNPTTNNRMEILGAIAGFEALNRPCEVDLYSDSRYLVDAFNEQWITTWQQNGWITASKKPVKNQDLWKKLLEAISMHHVTWHWVKGHAGNPVNERCDHLATKAADAMKDKKKANLDEIDEIR